ncbi:hypothetical protein SEA_LIGMA_47 [Gordonia phage Ligma]|nr:hypothetical protein SEA_LIGMA_47 [Gordonia phage Ligma]UQT02148.1 hypothetical protein SEA_AXUMITE_47 [Gordonia phage Axumite]
MQFSRIELIDTIKTALSNDDAARDKREQQIEVVHAQYLASWDDSQWRAFRDRLTALLKTGKPISYADLKGEWSRGTWDSDFAPPSWAGLDASPVRTRVLQVERDYPVLGENRRAELEAIEATLESVLDEVITDAQLGRLGYGAKAIGQVFRAATTVKG